MPSTLNHFVRAALVSKHNRRAPEYNIMYYSLDDRPGGSDPESFAIACAQAIADGVGTALAGVYTSECQFVGVQAGVVYDDFQGNGAVAVGLDGNQTGDTLPSFTAVVLNKYAVSGGGTAHRGRWYIGNVPEAFSDDNIVTAGSATVYETLCTALLISLMVEGKTLVPCLYSTRDDSLSPLLACHPRSRLATQRHRRMRGALV